VKRPLASDLSHHSTPNVCTWQGQARIPLGLLALTILYFWPQLVQGKVLYWGDIGLYFTPMQSFLRDNLRAGRLPLWNPLILCGTPYVGNPQTWPLYPVTALLPFVSASQFINLTVALHVWLAGMGTYLFGRRALGLGHVASLLAAVTFMFGGQFVSKEQFPNMVQAMAWLPWILWRLDSLLRCRRVRNALLLGLVLGLQLLAAHVQMTVLTLYLAAAFGLFAVREDPIPAASRLSLPSEGRVASLKRDGIGLLLSGVVAAGLAMGQILPTLALFQDAARHWLPFAIVNRFFLPVNEIGNFLLPRLHGHPFYGDWTGRGNFWETCCYVGWLPFALAVWGGVSAWRGQGIKPLRFWTGVFIVSLWMALGGHGGLYHLAYFALPGFRAFHDPARCLFPACFALSLLAGYGAERIRTSYPSKIGGRGAALLILLITFADLAHFGRTLYPLADPAALFPIAPNIAIMQADPDVERQQARILAPSAGVWLRFTNYKDFGQNTPSYQTLWADTLTPNLMMPYGIASAYGYEPVAMETTELVAGKADHAFDPKAGRSERAKAALLAGALGVKYVAVCRVTPPEATIPGLVPVHAVPTLAPPGRKREKQAFVYLSRNTRWQPRARLEGSANPVIISEDRPDKVTLSFTSAAPARLILADAQADGWLATRDGVQVPIETTEGCLRAVSVPNAGAHTVVFAYRPTPFLLGLYLSLLTLCSLVGAAVFARAIKIFSREGFGVRGRE